MTVPTFVALGTSVGSGSPQAPGLHAGHVLNDVLLLLFETDGGDTIATPSGYGIVADSPQDDAGSKLHAFWKRDNGSESAPSITIPGNHATCQILGFRGCIETGNPWDVTAGNVSGGSQSGVSIPGDTTTVADCLVVAACSEGIDSATGQFSGWANAGLTNVTERTNIGTPSGNGGGFGVATGEKATAGAFGATTATLASATRQGRLMIALKPAVAVSGDSVGMIIS